MRLSSAVEAVRGKNIEGEILSCGSRSTRLSCADLITSHQSFGFVLVMNSWRMVVCVVMFVLS